MSHKMSYYNKLREYAPKVVCKKTHHKKYYAENTDRILARQKRYRAKNVEILKTSRKRWYKINKERVASSQRAHCQQNKEHIRNYRGGTVKTNGRDQRTSEKFLYQE